MRADRQSRPLLHRVTALLLSWVFTATTFWSMAPPEAQAAKPVPPGPMPALIAGFPENWREPTHRPPTRWTPKPPFGAAGGRSPEQLKSRVGGLAPPQPRGRS